MPKVTINGTTIEVPAGTNLVQAAEMSGQEIPHYCYHPGLSVAGNCRMCLVDIRALSEKQPNPLPKLQIGCNTIVQDGMVVETSNEKVEEARRGVLEFILINHPIDCPICDQAGECKLQEYYMDYGRYHSRFALEEKVHKRKVVPVGPDIMLDQERCILCTRCIRFLEEVTETNELCITERGDHSMLTLAEGKTVDNPYSVNIVDICPVGALTSREFRFQSRVWYLDSSPSVCPGCATGCNVDVHYRHEEIFRLKPRANHEVNGYWMCDEGRRTHAGNRSELRLTTSYTRAEEAFRAVDAADAAARAAASLLSATKVAVVASAHLTNEEAFLLGCIADKLGAARILEPLASAEIEGDGKLISSDRSPNRRGVGAFGFAPAGAPPQDCDGFLVVRSDPAHSGVAPWQENLESASATVWAGDRTCVTTNYADHILALASHFESDGSYVNAAGRLQTFRASVPPPQDAVAGWSMLAALLVELGGARFGDFDELFQATARSLGCGDVEAFAALGAGGRALSDVEAATAS